MSTTFKGKLSIQGVVGTDDLTGTASLSKHRASLAHEFPVGELKDNLGAVVGIYNSDYSTISGGRENTISSKGTNAVVLGGYQAVATHYGQMAFASGRFAANGDAQTSIHVLRGSGSSGSTNELFLDGTTNRLTIPFDTVWAFDILIAARDGVSSSAGYQIQGVIHSSSIGITAFVGTPTVTVLGETTATWDAFVTADNVNDALVIKVVSPGATVIRWVATVRTTELTY